MRSRFGSLRARTTVLVATGMASALAIAALVPSIAPAANRPDGPSSASGSGGANAVQAVTMPNDGDSPAAAAAAASAHENAALAAPRHQDEAAYQRQKAAADRAVKTAKPSVGSAASDAPGGTLAPPTVARASINGISQASACSCYPPDTHGAIGLSHYVQVVNARVVVYTKTAAGDLNSVAVKSTALNTFFGSSEFLFDPRAFYDPTWNRYVVVATRRSTSSTDTVRHWFIAVTATGDPTGGWFVYVPTFGGGVFQNGDWLDFPMMGMDQDAVILSGNYFHRNADNSDSNRTTGVLSIAKARIYNGWGFSYAIRTGLAFSAHPAVVAAKPTGQDTRTWLVATDSGASQLHLYRLNNTNTPTSLTATLQANIAVSAFSGPPSVPQPGTTEKLDSGDTR